MIAPIKTRTDSVSQFERLRMRVAESKMTTRSDELSVTVSIGVARATAGSAVDAILGESDATMYRAKNAGRNRVAQDGG